MFIVQSLVCKVHFSFLLTCLLALILTLGEDKISYGYDSSGKKASDSEFSDYGQTFGADDVIGCYLVSKTDRFKCVGKSVVYQLSVTRLSTVKNNSYAAVSLCANSSSANFYK